MTDNVNHPSHYADNGPFECIELTQRYDFCLGNAIKYLWRHNDKGRPLEEQSRARKKVQREIDRMGEPGSHLPGDEGRSARLSGIDFAHMAGFWHALDVGNLDMMKQAIQSRIDTLTKQEDEA